MKRQKCIAMLLAGGEGKRLAPLTQKLAKPAVPFGGRYRIIDFPLSNCMNSGISTIGVLTQYKAESLHNHIADGGCWSCNDQPANIFLMQGSETGVTFEGTADAIYKNTAQVDQYEPEHVLILSGDHIYQMDYNQMLESHIQSGADATIAVKQVPWKDAHRFGIMNTDDSLKVTSFVEKPEKPESNLASMGIYLFRWSFLKEQLQMDAANDASSHDFGKDVIPAILEQQANVYAYAFQGYWRDVGTVDSLWEAHMDILDGEISLEESKWPMQTNETTIRALSYLHPLADIRESVIHPHSAVEGDVERSFVFSGVQVGRGSEIKDSIIMPNVKIGRNVTIYRAIIGEGSVIEDGAIVGESNGDITVLGADELVYARTSAFMTENEELLKGLVRRDAAATSESYRI
ncbi:glucose-1-phosphate adenylyltransferase [Paenibacillus sambharensis]|uniref:Glucose-1-phosphate adenylyltransferase n=1 Tax=Paenibacillus sambharensis TaxID=1803190 RepID=A0A2W1LA18_9BACL|nr:glucose-1-phosphate adenylyltransferase [Paenibacillus sambharensis]PZD94980.1 glucose-1-phosphate adenylyltransferase [Paenibacillus sambharensis]